MAGPRVASIFILALLVGSTTSRLSAQPSESSEIVGVFYALNTDDAKPSNNLGSFWYYSFSTGKREKIFEFPRSPSGNLKTVVKNNQILFNNGGTLGLLRLPDTKPVHIAEEVLEDQFNFTPDGGGIVYLQSFGLAYSINPIPGGSIHHYSISTRKTVDLMNLDKVDDLLGTSATNDRVYYTHLESLYAIHNGQAAHVYTFKKDEENPYDRARFILSPDGSLVLVTKESRLGLIIELGILDIPKQRYTMFDMMLAEKGFYIGHDRVEFSNDSKSIVGYHSSPKFYKKYTFWSCDLQSLQVTSVYTTTGIPWSRHPDKDAFLIKDYARANYSIEPEQSPIHKLLVSDSQIDNSSPPISNFIGWYRK